MLIGDTHYGKSMFHNFINGTKLNTDKIYNKEVNKYD
jgi:hypothetical protein